MKHEKLRFDETFLPVSGKALPVYSGEVLRIKQVKGEQCVDFNAFNLHDYKEAFSASSTAANHGLSVKTGDFLWSNPPRSRPMFKILGMSRTCDTDLFYPRCHAVDFERLYGVELHTNCQDTLAEAIGEYGLTPDDVHETLNLWMNVDWDTEGNPYMGRNRGRKGDYVDLLALFDALAVPVICGTDTSVNNFSLKPIRVQIYKSSERTLLEIRRLEDRHTRLRNQRRPADFHVREIRVQRELRATPGYVPNFLNYPLTTKTVTVELGKDELRVAKRLKRKGLGRTIGEVARACFIRWYAMHSMKMRG